ENYEQRSNVCYPFFSLRIFFVRALPPRDAMRARSDLERRWKPIFLVLVAASITASAMCGPHPRFTQGDPHRPATLSVSNHGGGNIFLDTRSRPLLRFGPMRWPWPAGGTTGPEGVVRSCCATPSGCRTGGDSVNVGSSTHGGDAMRVRKEERDALAEQC